MFNCDDGVDVTLVEYSDECVGWVTAVAEVDAAGVLDDVNVAEVDAAAVLDDVNVAEVDAAAVLDDVNVERMILAAVEEVTFVEFQGEVPL